jgi:hypothetical protein
MLTAETAPLTEMHEWQSDESLAEIEPRMQAMERLVRIYEMPLLNALEEEYGEKIAKRGWLVCGPASIVLANLISEDTGLPLLPFERDPTVEHLRMEMFMFNAYDNPDSAPKVDHTHLQYQTGKGFSLTIDPVNQLLWRGARKEPDAILVEWHYDHYVRDDMRVFHNLRTIPNILPIYRMSNRELPDVWGIEGRKPRYQDSWDMLHIMHSSAVFEDVYLTRSGDVIEGDFWGQRLIRVMQAVRQQIPTGAWQELVAA